MERSAGPKSNQVPSPKAVARWLLSPCAAHHLPTMTWWQWHPGPQVWTQLSAMYALVGRVAPPRFETGIQAGIQTGIHTYLLLPALIARSLHDRVSPGRGGATRSSVLSKL